MDKRRIATELERAFGSPVRVSSVSEPGRGVPLDGFLLEWFKERLVGMAKHGPPKGTNKNSGAKGGASRPSLKKGASKQGARTATPKRKG
jgi:hypothetical protein